MSIVPRVLDYQAELSSIRQDIHMHPEIAFEEQRTSDIVAAKLAEFGCEVHRGLAKTGVVGTLRRGNATRAIGLRADMDALPIQERNTFGHASVNKNKMHGPNVVPMRCGLWMNRWLHFKIGMQCQP